MAEIDYTKYGYQEENPKKEIDYSKYGVPTPANNRAQTPNEKQKLMESIRPSFSPTMATIKAGGIALGDVLSSLGRGISLVGNQGPEALKEIATHPVESALSARHGTGKMLENILNIPRNLPNTLSHLEVADPETMKMIDKFLPRFDFAKYMKPEGEQHRGQELINTAFENLLPIGLGAKAAMRVTPKLLSLGNKDLRKQVTALESNIPQYSKELEEAAEAHQKQLGVQEEAVNAAEEETGRATKPSKVKHYIGKTTMKTAEQEKQLQELNQQLEEHKKLPELPEVDTAKHEKNVANAENALGEAEQHIENTQEAHGQAENNLAQSEKEIGQHLNRGAAHDVRAAAQIKEKAEGRRKELSNEYEGIKDSLKENHVQINNTPQIQALNQRLIEMVKSNEMHTKEFKKLNDQLFAIENSKTFIPANDYLSMVKAAKDNLREAREKAFSTNMKEEERAMWRQRFDNYENIVEEMDKNLESSIPPEHSQKLKETNTGWRTEVKPLQRNNTYQTIKHRGRVNADIMDTLRGTDPGDVLMRDIIKSDPEILKNVVGQRYAHKPHELEHAGELENEYISQMPELQQMVESRKAHAENVETAKENIKNAENRHKEITNMHKQAVKEKGKAEKEAESIATEKEKRETKETSLREETEKHKKIISDNNAEIAKSKKHLVTLQKEAANTKLTKEEWIAAQKKIKQEKERLKGLEVKVDKSKGYLVKIARWSWRAGKKIKSLGI